MMPNSNTNEELDKLRTNSIVLRPQWDQITEVFKKLWGETEKD